MMKLFSKERVKELLNNELKLSISQRFDLFFKYKISDSAHSFETCGRYNTLNYSLIKLESTEIYDKNYMK